MLKLGGYGIVRFLPICGNTPALTALGGVSLGGGLLVRLICLTQIDIKVLIAYSSVAHMAFSVMTFSTCSSAGLKGGILVLCAHGISSSAIFFGANVFYKIRHSRNLVLNKGSNATLPYILAL